MLIVNNGTFGLPENLVQAIFPGMESGYVYGAKSTLYAQWEPIMVDLLVGELK